MIDLDIVFVLLTFGCILFVLQTLLDYNKRASKSLDEITALDTKHDELEFKAAELRKKTSSTG